MPPRKLTLTLLLMIVIVSAASFLPALEVKAAPDIIFSDSSDGSVSNVGIVSSVGAVGDYVDNTYRRVFFKFSLSGIYGTVSSAVLNLFLIHCFHDNDQGNPGPIITPPLPNIGLGDCQVIHIDNYGTLIPSSFNAPSIGNDPGVLISSTATPNIGYLSIDVKSAMQDDINNHRLFSTFMVKMSQTSDNDNRYDLWVFLTSELGDIAHGAPYIDYTLIPLKPVGGIVTPVNKLEILTPYLALVGLVAALSAVVVVRRIKA